eukprot:gene29261-38331_t
MVCTAAMRWQESRVYLTFGSCGDQFFLCGDQVRATAQEAAEKMRSGEVTPLTKLPILDTVKGPCVPLTQHKGSDLNLLGDTEDEKLVRMCRYCEQETVREELEGILQCDEICMGESGERTAWPDLTLYSKTRKHFG